MGKSSGIPYFCDNQLAHGGQVANLNGSATTIVKSFPRVIGVLIKAGGQITRDIKISCYIVAPDISSRSDVENYQHSFNELHGKNTGNLVIDDNVFLDCAIKTVEFNLDIVKKWLRYDVNFSLGQQQSTNTKRQLTPSNLYNFTRGRKATFTSSEDNKIFNIWHNIDIVRNLENIVYLQLYDKDGKNYIQHRNGGVENIVCDCWILTDTEAGWRQTVSAYMYNLINGPLGNLGTLNIDSGEVIIERCQLVGVELVGVFATSARYRLSFLVSLEC